MKRLIALTAVLLSFALLAAACGDDDDETASTEDTATEESQAQPAEETSEAMTDDDDHADHDHDDHDEDDHDDHDHEDGDSETSTDLPTVGLVYDIGGRGDQSFNDSAAAGIERAAAELGIEFTEASPEPDGSNRAEIMQLAASEHDIVVGVGFLYESPAAAVGPENPDTMFGVVDSGMLDFSADPPAPYADNIAGLVFAEHEGSFLVGAAAALKSQTGTIGFIGGVQNVGGLIERFQAGYHAGARAVNPDIEIIDDYITQAPDMDGFTSPDRAKEIALAMYEEGADIIYHAAGGSGAGLFQAAQEQTAATGSKVWTIGVDSDQYLTADPGVREFILTSMLKRVDSSIFEMIKSVIEGTMQPGPTSYDLSVDGVGYSTSGGFIDDIVDQLEAFREQIVSGEIVVPTEP
ncbi:MAG: BMP family ABC transporter substrate-binding protein [Acidimicrobiaceae bacterium]|nr:BMP family ABC transporter substrate-binding protein [Acidimicrobiaceae bacterium]MCY4176570.1 BMP family ABC transporter substrate-binding protein [Acidimicrobiaceae bacterium]MCY4279310.1 BMP family ABC transporter substrate-binding protein [Acidimicrobiaceae bacterium]MCY4294692.1 BMP family ABC transporter substrate-binding protein [Acidimicrobiaceae bacterium]